MSWVFRQKGSIGTEMDEIRKKLGRLKKFKYPLLVLLVGVLLMLLPLSTPKADNEDSVDRRLEEILSCSRGVGEARVLLSDNGVVVIGVSKDSEASHRKFAEKYELPFILLSDPEKEVIQAYGVWQEKKNYGKVSMGVVRSTFIIDEGGLIEKVMPKVKPDTNAEEIIDYLGLK